MKYTVAVGGIQIGRAGDLIGAQLQGSCMGLVVYDPVEKVGGFLHAMLPLSRINPEKAENNPSMFVDTGLAVLFKSLYRIGAKQSRLIVKAIGCGNPIGKSQMFNIGERNYTVLKKLLLKNNILLDTEDVGGASSRMVQFDVSSGNVSISSNGVKTAL